MLGMSASTSARHKPGARGDVAPASITGVWAVAGRGQRCLRREGKNWRLFETRGEGIDDSFLSALVQIAVGIVMAKK